MSKINKLEMPWWKKLNAKRSKGEWVVIDGWNEKREGEIFPSLIMGGKRKGNIYTYKNPRVIFNESHNQQADSIMANAQYTALAVNNLEALAEALTNIIDFFENYPPHFADGKSMAGDLDLSQAREALTRLNTPPAN